MSHLPRLLKLLNTAARYGLDDISPAVRPSGPARLLFGLWSLPWRLHPARRLPPPVRLRLALEELGPIYIKFGQLLSTRRDFLPTELADELQSLQDNVPGFSSPSIQQIVEQTLSCPWQEVFSELSTTPLASASVAQVHSARLHNGDEVVVKGEGAGGGEQEEEVDEEGGGRRERRGASSSSAAAAAASVCSCR